MNEKTNGNAFGIMGISAVVFIASLGLEIDLHHPVKLGVAIVSGIICAFYAYRMFKTLN